MKLNKYYPQEVEQYNERMEENWFQKQIKEYCPELKDEQIDISKF